MRVDLAAFLITMGILATQLGFMLLELLVYLAMGRWYFALGPVIVRHRWQTRMTPDEATRAVEGALVQGKLAWRRYGQTFAVRRPWWEMSAYPRVFLRIEGAPDQQAAAIIGEVKPFLGGAPFLVPTFLAIPRLMALWFVLAAFVIAMYVYFFAWELPRLKVFHILRERLREAGVRACGKCGYDLYGLPAESPCPECGAPDQV